MALYKKLQRVEQRDITERKPSGLKLPLSLAQMTTGAVLNYDFETTTELRALRNFPSANQMAVMNTSTYLVRVRLGNSDSSSYYIPGNSLITLKSVDYQGFDVKNMGTGTITIGQVLIHAIYEDPEKVAVVA